MALIISIINTVSYLISLLVIVHIVLSYFMSPYHPIRQTVDGFIEPMLAPIRRLMPNTGMLDFSPMILIILVQLISRVLVGILIAL